MLYKFTLQVYIALLNLGSAPPEIGGVLGGEDMVISKIAIEKPCGGYEYIPNVDYLNKVIKGWNERGVSFYGMFHTHPTNATTLSKYDIEYIRSIMFAMPTSVYSLAFPLVIPQEAVILYVARKKDGEVIIEKEKVAIV